MSERYSRNFLVSEFRSPDGKDKAARMDPVFMTKLQAIRDELGKSIVINSAIRSKEHNRLVGGKSNSQHLVRPCACADISTKGWHPTTKHKFLELVFRYGFTGVGVADTFVHIDLRKQRSIWTY